jgi:predicted nucleic acid-binding protein
LYYLDTSALVKLVVVESETKALRKYIADLDPSDLVTSAITRAELLRAASRQGTSVVIKARDVLDGIAEITITRALLDQAASLQPATLRTLDAIHLATALEIGTALRRFVAYDARLLGAAVQANLPTLTPA